MSFGWPEELFRRMAVPRLPGSSAVAGVETLIADRLRRLGYDVEHQEFETSPKRLVAVAMGAAGCAWLTLGLFALLWFPAAERGIVLFAALLAGATGTLAALRMSRVARSRVRATNVVGRKGGQPRLWLVAHSDSKGQCLSLRGRVFAFAALGVGVLGFATCLMARISITIPVFAVIPWVVLAVVGGVALSFPPVVSNSPGAVDNASGVIAALVAADALKDRSDVGVLVTGAEEFGMEGARAWTGSCRRQDYFVNFDGIDDVGVINVMLHRPRGGQGGNQDLSTQDLRDVVVQPFIAGGYEVRRSPLPLGVFVDGSVLARVGLSGVTLSRGDWGTLGVVHTMKDSLERTSVRSAVRAGRFVGEAVAPMLG